MVNLSFEREVGLDEWIMAYPDYLGTPEKYFKYRPFFENVSGVGVEVGTFEGYNALGVMKFTPTTKLYCVDPYKAYDCVVGDYMGKFSQSDFDEIFERARGKLKDFNVEFMRMTSQEASQVVPDNLDWVYIDGDHSVEGCLNDLKLWGRKVKVGGKFGGHDSSENEVQIALSKWIDLYHLDLSKVKFVGNEWWVARE